MGQCTSSAKVKAARNESVNRIFFDSWDQNAAAENDHTTKALRRENQNTKTAHSEGHSFRKNVQNGFSSKASSSVEYCSSRLSCSSSGLNRNDSCSVPRYAKLKYHTLIPPSYRIDAGDDEIYLRKMMSDDLNKRLLIVSASRRIPDDPIVDPPPSFSFSFSIPTILSSRSLQKHPSTSELLPSISSPTSSSKSSAVWISSASDSEKTANTTKARYSGSDTSSEDRMHTKLINLGMAEDKSKKDITIIPEMYIDATNRPLVSIETKSDTCNSDEFHHVPLNFSQNTTNKKASARSLRSSVSFGTTTTIREIYVGKSNRTSVRSLLSINSSSCQTSCTITNNNAFSTTTLSATYSDGSNLGLGMSARRKFRLLKRSESIIGQTSGSLTTSSACNSYGSTAYELDCLADRSNASCRSELFRDSYRYASSTLKRKQKPLNLKYVRPENPMGDILDKDISVSYCEESKTLQPVKSRSTRLVSSSSLMSATMTATTDMTTVTPLPIFGGTPNWLQNSTGTFVEMAESQYQKSSHDTVHHYHHHYYYHHHVIDGADSKSCSLKQPDEFIQTNRSPNHDSPIFSPQCNAFKPPLCYPSSDTLMPNYTDFVDNSLATLSSNSVNYSVFRPYTTDGLRTDAPE